MRLGPARSHADPAVVSAKRARVDEPHMAPISDLCREIEQAVGLPVPFVDPDLGGTGARGLMLLMDPGRMTDPDAASGMISPCNDDLTAARVHGLMSGHGVDPARVMIWNIVPWLRPGNAGQALRVADLDAGLTWLGRLVAVCPELVVVLAGGRYAQRALDRPGNPLAAGIRRINAPHPSPLTQNQPRYREELERAFRAFAAALEE